MYWYSPQIDFIIPYSQLLFDQVSSLDAPLARQPSFHAEYSAVSQAGLVATINPGLMLTPLSTGYSPAEGGGDDKLRDKPQMMLGGLGGNINRLCPFRGSS